MMKKRIHFILRGILTTTLLLALAIGTGMAVEASEQSKFAKKNVYTDGMFSDVTASKWYSESVKSVYELGLMSGNGVSFNPDGNVTIAETVAIAARIHSIYYTGDENFQTSNPWYQTYIDYAVKNGITATPGDPTQAATRGYFAAVLANALPSDALPAINNIADGKLKDVPTEGWFTAPVYLLYRAGVLSGNDVYGTFAPETQIQRSAVAAIVSRMADKSLRLKFELQVKMVGPVQTYTNMAIEFIPIGVSGYSSTWLNYRATNLSDKEIDYFEIATGNYPNGSAAHRFDVKLPPMGWQESAYDGVNSVLGDGNGEWIGSDIGYFYTGNCRVSFIKFSDGTFWSEVPPVTARNSTALELSGSIERNSIGTPELIVMEWNKADIGIDSFEFTCTFVDSFGGTVTDWSGYRTYKGVDQEAFLPAVGIEDTYYSNRSYGNVWNLAVWDLAYDVRNLKVTRIKFSDGTIWGK